MTLELHATPAEVMRAVDALQEFGQARQVTERILFGLTLALAECASNIVNHSLRRDARQTFRVTLEHTGTSVVIELRDGGPEFDPTQAPSRGKDTSDDNRPPGGWGIQLVRHFTDDMRYTREGGENVLRLTRGLRAPTAAETTLLRNTITTNKQKPDTTMPLEIQILQNIGGQKTGAVTVKLAGSLDTTTAPELERRLAPVLASPVKDLVFDLAQLKLILSDGLREFMKARNTLKARGGQLAFVNLQPQIKEVFDIFRSLPREAVFESQAELDAYLEARQRSYEKSN